VGSWLFSYGTLQLAAVQRATFGRLLDGVPDRLTGWREEEIEITDPEVVALSGKHDHSILRFSGSEADGVDGIRFELGDTELAAADEYEVADYRRVAVALASGTKAFVYVSRDDAVAE